MLPYIPKIVNENVTIGVSSLEVGNSDSSQFLEFFGKSIKASYYEIRSARESPIMKQNRHGSQMFPRLIVTSNTMTKIVNKEKNQI